MNRTRGTSFFLAHWVFAAWVQVGTYGADIAPRASLSQNAIFFVAVPFLQLELIAGALIPGLAAYLCWRVRALRWLPVLILAAANFWLVANQVVYGVFFDHANLSLIDADQAEIPHMLDAMKDSVMQEFDVLVALNIAGALASIGWAIRIHPIKLDFITSPGPFRLGVIAWLAASLGASMFVQHHNLAHYPPFTMARSYLLEAESEPIPEPISEQDLFAHLHGDEQRPDPADDALRVSLEQLQSGIDPPNILLIMLESVGSKQLFPNGSSSERRTPNLARLLEHSVVFDSVYSTFPGTVRSLVSLFLGGRHPTWGNVHSLLTVPYTSPTLVSTLSDSGYASALYSVGEMNFESMNEFVGNLGFTRVVDAATQSSEWKDARRSSSWGVEDDSLRESAVRWMARQKRNQKPFFLTYITLATHHPYPSPEGYIGPFSDGDAESRYLNALHSSDAFVGRLIEDLKRTDILDELVIVVLGDHGQAFGNLHAKNFTHKNYLYEENVRSFLALIVPGVLSERTTSHRVGSMGDVMKTVLEAVDIEAPEGVVGQSLWPTTYRSRTVFFHKNTHPERWGLRDGRWKFIARKAGEREFELYDLDSDPDEAVNLAHRYPERLEAYQAQSANWFSSANYEFVSRLEGGVLAAESSLSASEVQSYGPKRLSFGERDSSGDFVPSTSIDGAAGAVVRTRWVAYPEDRTIDFEWTSPEGTTIRQPFEVSSDWTTTWLNFPGPFPMPPGKWQLILKDDQREVMRGSFIVTAQRH